MPFALLPQIPKTYTPQPAITLNTSLSAIFATFKILSPSQPAISKSISNFRSLFPNSVIAFSRQLYEFLTGDFLEIYDFPTIENVANTQADLLIYVHQEDQLYEKSLEIEKIFSQVFALTEMQNCSQFMAPHLDLRGNQFGMQKGNMDQVFDPDNNCFLGYLRYQQNLNVEFDSEEVIRHQESFQDDVLVHDYPCYNARVQGVAMSIFNDKLLEIEQFVRKQHGRVDLYEDPFLKGYQLVAAGFYVAPNLETFDEIFDRFNGDGELVEVNDDKSKKFKMEWDEEEEIPEEDAEEEKLEGEEQNVVEEENDQEKEQE